jgi:hypothetical protein
MASQNLATKKLQKYHRLKPLEALQDLANTPSGPDAEREFLKRHPDFLEGFVGPNAPEKLTVAESPMGTVELYVQMPGETPFHELQRLVRWAWSGTEIAFAILLSAQPADVVGKNGVVIPDPRLKGFRYEARTALQKTVYELLLHFNYAHICPNPDCPAPHFLSDDHRTKFCGRQECQRPSKLESKKKSFHKNKDKWRKSGKRGK